MRWLAVASAFLFACTPTYEWRVVPARPVAPATTISHLPTAKTFALEPTSAPDRGCVVDDKGTLMGDKTSEFPDYRLCFSGLRRQFERGVTALLSGLFTPGDVSPDYVARVKDFQLRAGVPPGRVPNYGSSCLVYEIHWDVELVDRQGAVIIDIKNVTPAGCMADAESPTDELDNNAARRISTAEGKILDAVRTALLASSAMQ